MSSISWTDYLSSFIRDIRELYETELSRDGLHLEDLKQISPNIKLQVFLEPCQIAVLEFPLLSKALWIVGCEENKPDKEFEIFEAIKESPKDFVKTHKKYKKYEKAIEFVEVARKEEIIRFASSPLLMDLSPNQMGYLFLSNPKEKSPYDLALEIFNKRRMLVFRALQRLRIERSTSTILKEVQKVKVSPSVLKEIESIQDSMGKLTKIDEHEQKLVSIKDELVGVRRLVATKGYGEWKALLSDIDKINTRIDALSDIKSAYDKLLSQQNEFMKQQAKVMEQQSSVIKWIRYATILLPIAVISVPVIEIINILIRHSLGIP